MYPSSQIMCKAVLDIFENAPNTQIGPTMAHVLEENLIVKLSYFTCGYCYESHLFFSDSLAPRNHGRLLRKATHTIILVFLIN